MALAKGKSEIRCGALSLHTETAIYVAKHLTEVYILVCQKLRNHYKFPKVIHKKIDHF